MIDAEDLGVTLPHEHLLADFFAMRNNRDYDRYYDQIPNELTKDIFTLTKEHPISVILPYAEFNGVAYYNTVRFIYRVPGYQRQG